ncbi:1-acyl-sn-glycerol-3-phosphate acyltransferase [Oscillospiraceae bacterium Marseille-Q3528]|nr:1-acyl-sn-glycerol-3-phosphate acyltransferase [Oscillospiraceae bacterium Marseille-Q3528]
MIRTILIALTLFLYLVLLLPVLGIEWIYHKINPEKADYQQLRMVQAAFRLMLKMTGARIQVIGEENVPKDRAVLYVGNHKSYFDILLTYSRVPRLTGYVAKKEMESFPILSIWMKRLHCLFLDRKDIKQGLKTILTGIDLIKNGISVCIFPEGTRNKSNDRLLPFKEGSLKMAEKTGCPIIPFAITNSSKLFEDHMPFVRPCDIIIEYGKPIYPAELPKEEKKFLGAYCRKQIEDMLIAHEA